MSEPQQFPARGRLADLDSARSRVILWLPLGVIVGSSVVVAVAAGSGWSWPLFWWGAGLGVVTAAAIALENHLILRSLPLREDDRAQLLRRLRERNVTAAPLLVVTGLAVGIAAAGLRSAFVDALFTVLFVLGILMPLALLPTLRRRARAR